MNCERAPSNCDSTDEFHFHFISICVMQSRCHFGKRSIYDSTVNNEIVVTELRTSFANGFAACFAKQLN